VDNRYPWSKSKATRNISKGAEFCVTPSAAIARHVNADKEWLSGGD
jgi:hypothetical protein